MGSLLVSSHDLQNPPSWAFHALGARLGEGVVVFLGVGSVPDYVRVRIEQLLHEMPDNAGADGIYVVSRSISSDWAELVPNLPVHHRLEVAAGDFLDELLRAIVQDAFARAEGIARGASARFKQPERSEIPFLELRQAFALLSSLTVMRWFSQVFFGADATSSLLSDLGDRVLITMALLSIGGSVEAFGDAVIRIDGRAHLVLASANQSAYAVGAEARRRAERMSREGLLEMGEEAFVVSLGHVGGLGGAIDIVDEPDETSIVDGPRGARLNFISGEKVLESEGTQS